ncbi:MAG: NUDIX hydrolase [Cyanobacteria bacterium P01_E01_bin.42]
MKENEIRLRVSVVALFVEGDRVLLLHQMTLPEPECWDLPGGGLHPEEPLLEGLRREVEEETGITAFQVEKLLTVTEKFYINAKGEGRHGVNIIYRCKIIKYPERFVSSDPQEVGPKGIQWLSVGELQKEDCSTRCWLALKAAGLIV